MNEEKKKYISNYNKNNYKMYQFRVKKSETELIEKLDKQSNRNNYIISLIKEKLHIPKKKDDNRFSRTQTLIGENNMSILKKSKVIVFGVGGVGGYVVETLARSGIGQIDIVDFDKVSLTNINRQIIALDSTIGKLKIEVLKERMLDINPSLNVNAYPMYLDESNIENFNLMQYDYVIDAIDSVNSKLLLIEYCKKNNINIISSMGTGNKLDPSLLKISDISKTSVCPLAKVIRYELRKRNINHLKVLFSTEIPIKKFVEEDEKKKSPSSVSFVPSVAGILIAREVVMDIIEN